MSNVPSPARILVDGGTIGLTRAIVDVIAPVHGKPSCTDADTTNGFGSGRDDFAPPRCNRCGLLELLDDPNIATTYRYQLGLAIVYGRIPWNNEACPSCRKETPGPSYCSHCGRKLPA